MSILFASALAAHAQVQVSAEDAQPLVRECRNALLAGRGAGGTCRMWGGLADVCSLSDRAGEAATLNKIGSVSDDLGDEQKTLEYQQTFLNSRTT